MIPKYLYHYTSTKIIKKILKNRTIKFSRMDTMNDPLEGIIKGFGINSNTYLSKQLYCSCWTGESVESIGMWFVYKAKEGKSVRIKARSDMFANFIACQECNTGFIPCGNIDPIKTEKRATNDNREITIDKIYGPIRIDYVSDDVLGEGIAKEVNFGLGTDEKQIGIRYVDYGNQKNKYWEYEKEWRYKISPFYYTDGGLSIITDESRGINNSDAYYVPLKHNIEEILLGPDATEFDYSELKDFLDNNGFSIPIKQSEIKIRAVLSSE